MISLCDYTAENSSKLPINCRLKSQKHKKAFSFSLRQTFFLSRMKTEESFKTFTLTGFSLNMFNRLTTASDEFSSSGKISPKSCMRSIFPTIFEFRSVNAHEQGENSFHASCVPWWQTIELVASSRWCVRRGETQHNVTVGRVFLGGRCEGFVGVC